MFMFFDPIDIPDELFEAQELGKLVVFAGAGVSMGEPGNLPSFKKLASEIAGSHPLSGKIDDFQGQMDRFLGELSRSNVDVQALCRSTIDNPSSRPTQLHRSIVDLFIKPEHVRIVTTNFDRHFLTAVEKRGWKTDCYHAPALPLGHQFCGLVYLHGLIERPEPLVLTDEDFGRAYLTEGWARVFLQRLFSEFTTLFVGYSHNDLPMEYLARGMSGNSTAPRFALAAAGEIGPWASLRIREITFRKTTGSNPFENLYAGVKRWADFTSQQPTDIAERVRAIVCAPEALATDRFQTSLLKRCLDREDSCHFFTRNAKGWRWVKWLQEEGLLHALFDPSQRELSQPQLELADWLAGELLAEASDDGLLIVKKYECCVGRRLWSALCRRLDSDTMVEWTSPLIQKWVLVLLENCPRNSMAELSHLFPKILKCAPDRVGMVLLRRLTSLRTEMTTAVDFEAFMNPGDTIEPKETARFEIILAAEADVLAFAVDYLLSHHFADLAEPLIVLLENRIREGHEIYRTAEQGGRTCDPSYFRGRIYEREAYPTGRGMSAVLDCLMGVVRAHSNLGPGLTAGRIESWLESRVPVLVRVGLHSLHLSKRISEAKKVMLVKDHKLVHPEVHGATHEAWQVLAACYPELNESERVSLWHAVNEGPEEKQSENFAPEAWQKHRTNAIDRLTWFLAEKNPACPAAKRAIDDLEARQPGFRGYEGMDQVSFGKCAKFEDPQTPKSAADLLSSPPELQIDWLLTYRGGQAPFEESRQGLLDAVGAACAERCAWGVSLLEELGARQAWDSDLWAAAFRRMNVSAMPTHKLTWLLQAVEGHLVDTSSLHDLTTFLFLGVDVFDEKRHSPENLDLMIRVSLLIWERMKGEEARVTDGFKNEEWTYLAINHPAGVVAKFWLTCCESNRQNLGPQVSGFPDWLTDPFADMITGADLASQLGRVTLGLHVRLICQVNPAWAAAQLFPKFQFSKVGEEAFLMWEPHASVDALSREVIFLMKPIYREAFQHFHDADNRLQTGFYRQIANMVGSGLFDVNEDNWFRDFLTTLSNEERANWARQLELVLRGVPDEGRAQIWKRWINGYWDDRLHGRPCPLAAEEAGAMLDWAFLVGAAFPEAVALAVRGPRIQRGLGKVIHMLKKHEAPEIFPDAVLQLLDWLLKDIGGQSMTFEDIKLVLFRLPKRREFLPRLNSICQHLVSLGCTNAPELKLRIDETFTENS